MMHNSERRFDWIFAHEKRADTYGVHRWNLKDGQMITAVSSPTWQDFLQDLELLDSQDLIVVSPELMTATDINFDEIGKSQSLIEARIEQIKSVSLEHPNTTIILGTPTFDGSSKPHNSAIFVKAGQILGMTHKRSGATQEEKNTFSLFPTEPASLVPATNLGVLICADIATASIYSDGYTPSERTLFLSGRQAFIGTQPTFIHPQAKNLLVLSCWGVGGNIKGIEKNHPNQYYYVHLRNVVSSLMRTNHRNLDQVITIDRVPEMDSEIQKLTPTQPFNILFTARDEWLKTDHK